ncbi:acyl-protein synthetase [Marinospirillum perlucidum]|uniref:LuxE/PaaK family acyltransferase n=1 Tax=Marinospirillum perlucidum TaxID=1982602 RepID=UPI000DF132E0|nr:acyl-protein synthetase [Marinospirillum perlucidum]
MILTQLLQGEPYNLQKQEKQPILLEGLNELNAWHHQNCTEYSNLLDAIGMEPPWYTKSVTETPYLTVPLFKQLELKSISEEDVFKVLHSSGTTGQTPSRIFLDRDTAALQSKTLVRIMQHWLGKPRRPMLILDHPGVIKDRQAFTARGAGIQGISFMGRNHCYALHEDMSLNLEAIIKFEQAHSHEPVLMFGFTFMVWVYFLQALQKEGIKLNFPKGFLLHSGGWKKLQDQSVDNSTFKQEAQQLLGLNAVHNFYGMVEQIGSIFVECEEGHLHTPAYADVLVREPGSWKVLNTGQTGLLQLVSLIPKSYPGHSLLTEDLGKILGEDSCPCGRAGKYFLVEGRMKRTEVRGCSDTYNVPT